MMQAMLAIKLPMIAIKLEKDFFLINLQKKQ